MSKFHELDYVRILVPVSGISEVEERPVSFPAGTDGTLVVVGDGGGIVEIGWAAPDNLSCDGLLVPLHDDQIEHIPG